ncbi:MAG TPA: hypothetical protein VK912_03050 [Longimicrobiales bacterium]|nr:hypothetical protein [Longimicrobiales bacterium]
MVQPVPGFLSSFDEKRLSDSTSAPPGRHSHDIDAARSRERNDASRRDGDDGAVRASGAATSPRVQLLGAGVRVSHGVLRSWTWLVRD